jgi:hypothetical protein
MTRNLGKLSIGIQPAQIIVAKNCIFRLYSDRFNPALSVKMTHLLSDGPEVAKMYQTKNVSARLTLSEKTL